MDPTDFVNILVKYNVPNLCVKSEVKKTKYFRFRITKLDVDRRL